MPNGTQVLQPAVLQTVILREPKGGFTGSLVPQSDPKNSQTQFTFWVDLREEQALDGEEKARDSQLLSLF